MSRRAHLGAVGGPHTVLGVLPVDELDEPEPPGRRRLRGWGAVPSRRTKKGGKSNAKWDLDMHTSCTKSTNIPILGGAPYRRRGSVDRLKVLRITNRAHLHI